MIYHASRIEDLIQALHAFDRSGASRVGIWVEGKDVLDDLITMDLVYVRKGTGEIVGTESDDSPFDPQTMLKVVRFN